MRTAAAVGSGKTAYVRAETQGSESTRKSMKNRHSLLWIMPTRFPPFAGLDLPISKHELQAALKARKCVAWAVSLQNHILATAS